MFDPSAGGPVTSSFAGGLGLAFGLFIFRTFWVLFFGRLGQKEAQVDAKTQLLIEGLEHRLAEETKRVDQLEEGHGTMRLELDHCKDEHAECRAELAELKGLVHGQGDARQQAQLIIAAEKAADKRKPRSQE